MAYAQPHKVTTSFPVLTPYVYRGAPVHKEELPKGLNKPSKSVGDPKKIYGTRKKTHFFDPYNASDIEEDTPRGKAAFEGWLKAATENYPLKFIPVSNDNTKGEIKREGEGTLEVGPERILNSGEGFTRVPLRVSIISYKGDINYVGTAASKGYRGSVADYLSKDYTVQGQHNVQRRTMSPYSRPKAELAAKEEPAAEDGGRGLEGAIQKAEPATEPRKDDLGNVVSLETERRQAKRKAWQWKPSDKENLEAA